MKVVCNIGVVLILGFLFIVMFLILNIIKIMIVVCCEEIEIMCLVGVINFFICWLFFIEGLFLGVFGFIVLIVVIIGVYSVLYNEV